MKAEKPHLVYIAGASRSGSTLLSRLLGSLTSFYPVGEAARSLFDRRRCSTSIPCGCGKKASNCDLWADIIETPSNEAKSFVTKYFRTRYYPLILTGMGQKIPYRKIAYEMASVYQKVAEKQKVSVIVDSSKTIDFVYLLSNFSDLKVKIIKLVRRPESVAASWRRRKSYLDGKSIVKSSLEWTIRNVSIELVGTKKTNINTVKYENLVNRPEELVKCLGEWIIGKSVKTNNIDGNKTKLANSHILYGNPDKYNDGVINIQNRNKKLSGLSKLINDVLTFGIRQVYY